MEFNQDYFKSILPKRPQYSHKGTFGHILNIAGSNFYTGAAYFSSLAPLKVGCGKSSLNSDESVLKSIASLSPDIILLPEIKDLKDFQAVSIGCGLSTEKNATKRFKKAISMLNNTNIPTVIDADGLNIISKLNITKLPPKTILTPHPKEMSRLMQAKVEDIIKEPQFWARKCSEKYNCTTVLKLHNTVVIDNKGNLFINGTGNTALSHGGSGDVLCGMITGFLAQGLSLFEACVLGVYLHGLTSEIASEELTEYSTLASDLLNYIPKAIKKIFD